MVSAAKNMGTRNQGPDFFFLAEWGRNGISRLFIVIQVFAFMMMELNHELAHYALRGECDCVKFPPVFAGERDSKLPGKLWSINGKGRIHLPCPPVDATL